MADIIKIKKSWGAETWIENNELYCGKLLECNYNCWSSNGKYHWHKKKDETFYIIEGSLLLDINGKEYILQPGFKFRIKPNTKHRFKSITTYCKFYEFSTKHEDSDSYYE